MINTPKVKGRIIEKGTTIKALAKKRGLSAYQLGRKLNNLARMSLEEAEFLQNELGIPDQDFSLFFYSRSCETQQENTA